MCSRDRWSDQADTMRLDTIALLLDVRNDQQMHLHNCLRARDLIGAADYNILIAQKLDRALDILRKARNA